MNFQFIKFEKTPNEKHLGIATFKLYDKIIVRYKILPTKDGSSFFPCPPSIKLDDKYLPAFSLDSNSEKEYLDNYIKECVRNAMSNKPQSQPKPHDTTSQETYMQPSFLDTCPF